MTTEEQKGGGGWSRAVLTFAAALGIAGLIALGVMDAKHARSEGLLPAGAPAPAFKIDKLGGGSISLEDYRGKVLMLDFWATWCAPCVHEMPILVKLAKEYEDQGLAFVAASREDSPQTEKVDVALFVDRRLPPLGPYVGFSTPKMAAEYGVEALPTLYFIDPQGAVISANRGALNERQLRAQIEAALGR